MKTDFAVLVQTQPAHPASKMIALVEEAGGSTIKPSYDGLHLVDQAGRRFALLKCVKGDSFALYLHSTTVPQTLEFARQNAEAWLTDGRITLDKKGYEPARLSGIKADEVTPEFLALVQGCVADGASKRVIARQAVKAAPVAE